MDPHRFTDVDRAWLWCFLSGIWAEVARDRWMHWFMLALSMAYFAIGAWRAWGRKVRAWYWRRRMFSGG